MQTDPVSRQGVSDAPEPPETGWYWAFRGMRSAVSIPALILTAAFVGYASLARESGLTLGQTLAMTGLVWALPSIVVLTGAITSGLGMVPAAIAVALASVRLMPMTMALMPILRGEGKVRRLPLLFASHFVAVTAWVFAMRNLESLPRPARLPFFLGFGGSLTGFVFCMTGVSFLLVDGMPPMVAGALSMLTPIYFLCSMWSAARVSADKAALMVGLVLGPVFYLYAPGLDLLWTGLLGGTIAYVATRIARRGWR
jgi:predicted branched-subunit amino acid permease